MLLDDGVGEGDGHALSRHIRRLLFRFCVARHGVGLVANAGSLQPHSIGEGGLAILGPMMFSWAGLPALVLSYVLFRVMRAGAGHIRVQRNEPWPIDSSAPTTSRRIIVAKVTGRARYAEDFRAEGMLFCKLLLSPQPHARVRGSTPAPRSRMPGVRAILTADDLPDLGGAERALTNEPLYGGEPILAVAAVDEETAAEAIERIDLELEPLPFVIDPLDSLRPGGPDARTEGNVWGVPPARAGARAQPPRARRSSA